MFVTLKTAIILQNNSKFFVEVLLQPTLKANCKSFVYLLSIFSKITCITWIHQVVLLWIHRQWRRAIDGKSRKTPNRYRYPPPVSGLPAGSLFLLTVKIHFFVRKGYGTPTACLDFEIFRTFFFRKKTKSTRKPKLRIYVYIFMKHCL